ncbi:MAG: preprotein translocase subunit SecG [Prevotella sp.]|nr:preprotein translocase subunit SecG [Prevotella sp.]
MYTLFVVLIVIAALLMIGIVLIQESKGGGLASNFSSSNQIMGVRKTTDFVEKATWGLAIAMVVFSVVCAYVAPTSSSVESVIEKAATEQQKTNPTNLPGFGVSQPEEAAPAEGAQAPKAAAPDQTPEDAAPDQAPEAGE